MVVKIVLTEKMIENFNQCDDRKDYQKFYTDNREFFENLFEKLKFVESPHELDNSICSNAKFLLRYLWKWDRNSPFLNGDKPTEFEKAFSNLFDFLKTDVMTDKWNILYSEYVFAADSIIKRARKQGIFDFQIEYNTKFYETFKARDTAKQAEMKTLPEYPDATEYDSSDSEDEVVSSDEDSEDEIEDSDDDDSSSDDSEDDLKDVIKELSEKLDTEYTKLASLEATNKTPTNDSSSLDLKAELAKMSQIFSQGMVEFRVVMSNFKVEINDKLEQMEARIKQETLEKSDFLEKIDEKLQVMKSEITLEIGTKLAELDGKMNTSSAILEANIDEKLQMMKSKINLDIGTKFAEFDEKMNKRSAVLEGKIENLAMLIEEDNETESGSDDELDLDKNKDQDDKYMKSDFVAKPKLHENKDGNKPRKKDDDEDILEKQEDFERTLVEQNRLREEELRRVQELRREFFDSEPDLDENRDQDNEEDIERGLNFEPELHENVALDDDEDIREMEEAFQRALAEQTRAQEEELRRVQERRKEMNRAAEEERRRIRNAANGGAGGL